MYHYIYTYMYIYIYIHTHVCLYIYIYIHITIYIHTCMHACMHACTFIHTYIHTYIHTHTYTTYLEISRFPLPGPSPKSGAAAPRRSGTRASRCGRPLGAMGESHDAMGVYNMDTYCILLVYISSIIFHCNYIYIHIVASNRIFNSWMVYN